MRFLLIILLYVTCTIGDVSAQLIDIADARSMPLGSTVTVTGHVTSGSEFGTIRYMQDGTGGIAIFSTSLAGVSRGDNITVTGVTSDFQNLLEIAPVNQFTVNSIGNPDPAPLVLTPSQLNETNESMIVRINNVTFTSGGVFQGNATYNFTSNGETGMVYIRSGNPLVGTVIPSTSIILYGIISQFGNNYQVLPRNQNDLVNSSVISITVPPFPENITTTGLDVKWNTDMNGNSFLRYGLTTSLELGVLTGNPSTTNAVVPVSGLSPSTVFYVQAFSVAGSDTATSAVVPLITASNSTGDIKVYFDRSVNNAVANPPGNLAVQLPTSFDDTLKAYIDRAVSTLDIAIYSFVNNNTALLSQAINDAWNRGVIVRIITDGGNVNSGLQTLNPAIPVAFSPTSSPFYYGIMHNKYFVIDANDPDPDKPVVMTGSTNWSDDQLNSDRNNLVFIQDKSLAKVYTMEFEEMWGTSASQPDTLNAKFGPDKSDNTPHILNIAGKKIEVFFSPTDDANNQIFKSINSANDELYFATMVFTRYDLAYGIEDRVQNYGVSAAGIMNDSSGSSGVSFQIIQGAIGNNMLLFDHVNQTGMLHHKYLIVDQGSSSSDPLVLTGSHNWSSAANQRNDENTIIIHDQQISNQFYQEFNSLFISNGGALGASESPFKVPTELSVFPNPSTGSARLWIRTSENNIALLKIYDNNGKMLSQEPLTLATGDNLIPLEVNKFNPGIYYVKLEIEDEILVRKLMIPSNE